MSVVRTSISLKREIMESLDRIARESNATRSWVIMSAVESYVMERMWMLGSDDEEVGGAIIVLYETGHVDAEAGLARAQHSFLDQIRSSLHVHLTENLCLEVIAVRGKLKDVKRLAREIEGRKGVISVKYSIHPLRTAAQTGTA